jgi:hypothetical protein
MGVVYFIENLTTVRYGFAYGNRSASLAGNNNPLSKRGGAPPDSSFLKAGDGIHEWLAI